MASTVNRFLAWLEFTGSEEVAKLLGVSVQTVRNWQRAARGQRRGTNSTRPNEQSAAAIVRATKGRVTRADIYEAFAR